MTIDNLRAAQRMGRAARYIFDVVVRNCRAVPVVHAVQLASHEIVMTDDAEGAAGLELVEALERNMGALAELIPPERAVVVSAADLAVLLACAKMGSGRAALWDAAHLHTRGIEALDAWAHQRGREMDGTEQ